MSCVICPSPFVFALDNYAHALTVDTRPFPFSLLGGAGPGYEATPTYKPQHPPTYKPQHPEVGGWRYL